MSLNNVFVILIMLLLGKRFVGQQIKLSHVFRSSFQMNTGLHSC